MNAKAICWLTEVLAGMFCLGAGAVFWVMVVVTGIAPAMARVSRDDDQQAVYQGCFELLDVFGTKGTLHYTQGCLTGDADTCRMMVSVPVEVDGPARIRKVDGAALRQRNYLSYLKSTGQSLQVRFQAALPAASDTNLSSYKVFYSTENKSGRMVKNMDASVIPTRLKNNPLLLFAILATHQSSLDLVFSLRGSLYSLSLPWLDVNIMRITNAGRGGYFGYQYYVFPRDSELFLDLGGPFSINGLSEGVGFSFADSDRTQPPVRMVTGYHGEQSDWFIHRMSAAFTCLALAGGFAASLWHGSLAGLLVSSLLLAVEARAGAASSEVLVLATRTLPDGFQFNEYFQGRHLLAVLRSPDAPSEPAYK